MQDTKVKTKALDKGNCGIARSRGKEAGVKATSPRTETGYEADGATTSHDRAKSGDQDYRKTTSVHRAAKHAAQTCSFFSTYSDLMGRFSKDHNVRNTNIGDRSNILR